MFHIPGHVNYNGHVYPMWIQMIGYIITGRFGGFHAGFCQSPVTINIQGIHHTRMECISVLESQLSTELIIKTHNALLQAAL